MIVVNDLMRENISFSIFVAHSRFTVLEKMDPKKRRKLEREKKQKNNKFLLKQIMKMKLFLVYIQGINIVYNKELCGK